MQLIDKSSPVPFYQQIADVLEEEIETHRPLEDDYQLPSEHELASLHGVSRTTIRRALDVLDRKGLIYRERGKGSFAAARRVEHELTKLVSTTEHMRQRGWSLETRVVSLEREAVPSRVAQGLELSRAVPVYKLRRVRVVEGEPAGLETAYLPTELTPGLEKHDLTHSLYRILETHYGLRLWSGREILRARCALPEEQELLDVGECTAVMYVERVTYAASGEAVEYLEAVWRGDRYDFTVSLSRAQA